MAKDQEISEATTDDFEPGEFGDVSELTKAEDMVGGTWAVFYTGVMQHDEKFDTDGLVCHFTGTNAHGEVVSSDPTMPAIFWQTVIKRQILNPRNHAKWTVFRLEKAQTNAGGNPVYIPRRPSDEDKVHLYTLVREYMKINGFKSNKELIGLPQNEIEGRVVSSQEFTEDPPF